MTYMTWRRERALSESRALRQLVRHGRRHHTPDRPTWRDWQGWCHGHTLRKTPA